MIRISKVTMTMRELDRLKCIQGLIDGQLKQTGTEPDQCSCGLLRQWRARGSTHRTPGLQGLGSRARRPPLQHVISTLERTCLVYVGETWHVACQVQMSAFR
jgi:hypothetical protein